MAKYLISYPILSLLLYFRNRRFIFVFPELRNGPVNTLQDLQFLIYTIEQERLYVEKPDISGGKI